MLCSSDKLNRNDSMELNKFVEETLKQVLDGIKSAQATESNGGNVNADIGGIQLGGKLINAGKYGNVTRVDFDVSVSAETSGGAGAKLKVFGVGVEGGGERRTGSENRISFSVPVRLPDGDKERATQVERDKEKFMRSVKSIPISNPMSNNHKK